MTNEERRIKKYKKKLNDCALNIMKIYKLLKKAKINGDSELYTKLMEVLNLFLLEEEVCLDELSSDYSLMIKLLGSLLNEYNVHNPLELKIKGIVDNELLPQIRIIFSLFKLISLNKDVHEKYDISEIVNLFILTDENISSYQQTLTYHIINLEFDLEFLMLLEEKKSSPNNSFSEETLIAVKYALSYYDTDIEAFLFTNDFVINDNLFEQFEELRSDSSYLTLKDNYSFFKIREYIKQLFSITNQQYNSGYNNLMGFVLQIFLKGIYKSISEKIFTDIKLELCSLINEVDAFTTTSYLLMLESLQSVNFPDDTSTIKALK